MCGDATKWDEEAYRDSILKERELQTLTVFRTAWPPSLNPTPQSILLASSHGTLASYSISSCISNLPSGFNIGNAPSVMSVIWLGPEPSALLRGHDGSVYDAKFYGDGEDALLLSCGDDGRIRGWSWKEFAESDVPISSQGNHVSPRLDMVNPQDRGPWGALSPVPENNAIAVDTQGGCIFSAAGDSCAYCWDVETCKIKMVFKGHLDYLHCIVARKCASQIITGSEDGTARIWVCKSGKCVRVIEPQKDMKLKGFSSCVRSLALDTSESWLACSSGRCLSVWNIPAFECVSRTSCGDVTFDDNQILAVGAEPLLSRVDLNGSILSQIPCAPPSAFSVSLHPSGLTAIRGYGGLVDIISQFGSHYCTFQCGYA